MLYKNDMNKGSIYAHLRQCQVLVRPNSGLNRETK